MKPQFILLIALCILQEFSYGAVDSTFIKREKIVADSLFDWGDYSLATVKFQNIKNYYFERKIVSQQNIYEIKSLKAQNRLGNFEKALSIIDSIINLNKEKSTSEFQYEILLEKSYNLLSLGRADLALQQIEKITTSLKSKHLEIEVLSLQGLCNWVLGNDEEALKILQNASIKAIDYYGTSSIFTAKVYNNLGLVFARIDIQQSKNSYEKALEIYKKNYKNEQHPAIAICYNNIAISYKNLADYDKSLDFFDKTLRIWTKIYGENHINIAFLKANIAEVFFKRKSDEKAKRYLFEAEELYKSNIGLKYPELANVYNQLGSIYLNQSKFKKAIQYFNYAIAANETYTDTIHKYYLPNSSKILNANIALASLIAKSDALFNLYQKKSLKERDLKAALVTIQLCDTLIDNLRKSRNNKADKLALGNIGSIVYESGIKISLALADVSLNKGKFYRLAFYFNEKSKAATLLESISETKAKTFAGIPDSILEDETELKAEIAYLEQQIAKNSTSDKLLKEFSKRLFEKENQYNVFTKKLERQYPQYFDLKFNNKVASVEEIQSILQNDEALISYFTSESRIYIFNITKSSFDVYDELKNEDAEKLIIGFRNSIIYNDKELFVELGYTLYQQYLSKIKLKENLIIIPDGRLASIPFEAFLLKKTDENELYQDLKYLSLKSSVSYQFSATIFKNGLSSPSKDSQNEALFCAPIAFPNIGINLASLPGSKSEVDNIAVIFRNNKFLTQSFQEKNATELKIKSENLLKYKYLHFATHGLVNETKPELSEIFLQKEGNEDGNLYSGEIFNLKLNAKLITLSACQTGLGKITKGEGMIGLSRALVYAGAQNLIVSLWTVNDNSTSDLMQKFYAELLLNKEQNINKSLQMAKKKLIKNPSYSAPYYWAAFVLIGK